MQVKVRKKMELPSLVGEELAHWMTQYFPTLNENEKFFNFDKAFNF